MEKREKAEAPTLSLREKEKASIANTQKKEVSNKTINVILMIATSLI